MNSKHFSPDYILTKYLSLGSLLSFIICLSMYIVASVTNNFFKGFALSLSFFSLITFLLVQSNIKKLQQIAPYFIIISINLASFYHSFDLRCTTPLLLVILYLFIAGFFTDFKFITSLFISDLLFTFLGLILNRFQFFPTFNPENNLIYSNAVSIFLPALLVAYLIATLVNKVLLGTIKTIGEQFNLLKMTQQQLIAQEKIKSIQVFAGGLAHDLNNILMSILGSVYLVKSFPDEIEENKELLEEAEKACYRAKNLTQQLLTFSKNTSQNKKNVKLNNIIKEVTTFSLRGTKIEPIFSISDKLWGVYCDKDQISQVIQNLVINAAQASSQGGKIEINADNIELARKNEHELPKDKYIKISIVDYGIGISPNNVKNLFNPFFTTKEKGSGLGLSICYNIIKIHDGILYFTSNTIGSTFTLLLPAIEKIYSEEMVINDFKLELNTSNRGKVLMMDDKQDIRKIGRLMLKKLGFITKSVKNGSQALYYLRKTKKAGDPFSFLILDFTIPGEKGALEIIDEIRLIEPKIKIILSSGYTNSKITENYKEMGFDFLLSKPYHIKDLKNAIQKLDLDTKI